ncbi:MAG: sensor histidine kinase [Chloroflexi bacterium]|nr:MAG: sensor histidine kinase [Chloroflexota bacterium]
MAAAVVGHPTSVRAPAIAAAAIAIGGSLVAVATLLLTILDRQAAPGYTLAGLDVGWSLAVRTLVETVALITMSWVCAIVVWRRPTALLSLLFLMWVVFTWLQAFAAEYAIHGLLVAPGSLPLADAAAWSEKFVPGLALLGGAMVVLTFPDGRLKSSRWRVLVVFAVLDIVGDMLIGLDDPYPLRIGAMAQQWVPVSLPPALWASGASIAFASGVFIWARQLLAVAVATYLVLRLVSASGEVRLQLKWFAYAGTFLIVTFSSLAGLVLVPIAIGIAIVRYRLYNIDLVINRTILYGGLALFVTGCYAVVVAGVGSVLGRRVGLDPLLSMITIALLAVLLLPVRSRLQAIANTAVYGKRARPYDVLSDFAGSIGRAEQAGVLLPRMAQLLREGTGASSTEVWVQVGDRLRLAASEPAVDASGPEPASIEEVAQLHGGNADLEPVFHDGELLGVLVVVKARGEELTAVERRLFHDLASQAGLVLGRFRLVQELRESRSRLVAAQDLERRRIERNLHDGAQQRFVNALLALGMAEAGDGPRGDRREQIQEASREVQAGLSELRSLARGLQPPLLTEAGLAPAARALADRTSIPTTVVAEAERRHPEGIESTAYFFIAEAVSNAVKHSAATSIEVRITESQGELKLEVSDNGVGGADPSLGSGLTGLRDRVAAAGGRVEVISPRHSGTVIRATLPCA